MKRIAHATSFVFLAIFIVCGVLQFLAGANIRALMLDTDALNIPTVMDNVMSHHGSLSQWYLSPAPYLFPDALIHVVIHLFTTNTYVQLAVFAAIQILLIFAAMWWLAVRIKRNHPLAIAVAITGNLTWMALLRGGPYNQLMTAGFHYGAFLVSVLMAALCVGTNHPRRTWVSLGALSFLTALSDNIFVIQTAVPFALVLLFVGAFDAEHRVHRLANAAVIAASSMLGSFAYGPFISHHTRYPVELSVQKFRDNAHAVRATIGTFLNNHEPIGVALVLCALCGVFYGARVAQRVRRTQPIALLALFGCASVISTCTGLVLATTNEMTIRYFIPVFTWPVIIGGLVIFNANLLREKVPVLVAGVTALILCLNTSKYIDTHGIDRSYYPQELACIDNALPQGVELHGIANYWDAKYVQAFSRRSLTVAQYWDNLTPMKWITTDDYYHSSYDFAIVSSTAAPQFVLSKDLIVKNYGPPTNTVTCGTRIVLVYERAE